VSGVAGRRLYFVAPARLDAGWLHELVPELARAGVDMVQLREDKAVEAGDLMRFARPVIQACEQAGVLFVVNDRPDVALALGCGVHVGQNDLPPDVARRIVPDAVVGLSTHAPSEVDGAVAAAGVIDYFCAGPVWATPTKEGRPASGLDLVRYAARTATLPWFAIGGIHEDNLADVIEAGARRIVVVRAIAAAADPPAAAARLRAKLDAVALV
jgi:thiamine-phosphate pyrophosphorylase